MKVYVTIESEDYQGGHVLGVNKTLEGGIACAKAEVADDTDGLYDWHQVSDRAWVGRGLTIAVQEFELGE